MQIGKHAEGHYEAQEVEFGKVYSWYPESVEVVCDCGEGIVLTASQTACVRCEVDHGDMVREELSGRQPDDETAHPWRYDDDMGDYETDGIHR